MSPIFQPQVSIPATYMRGGTSKGVFFRLQDLPAAAQAPGAARDALLLRVIGSPDPYGKQIDGMGGATSSTSKTVIVAKSTRADHDVDYLFGQVSIDKPFVDWSGNCGNLSAAVGPFAISTGLVDAVRIPQNGVAVVRIWQANIGKTIISHVPITDGQVQETGDFELDGVTFPALAGSVTVDVQNAPGRLDAWIDFDHDGQFEAGEQIFTSLSLPVGVHNLTYAVPSGALEGVTYARFRISTYGNLAPTGVALDGEVEDDLVTLDIDLATPDAVNDAADAVGLALYAAVKQEPLVDDAPGRAGKLLTVPREHRGSAHLVALRAVGLSDRLAHHLSRPQDAALFGWNPAEPPEVTDEHREMRRKAEAITDDIVRHLRDCFLSLMAPELVQLPDVQAAHVADQAQRLGAAAIVRAMERLGEMLVEMRHAPDPRLLLDVALMQNVRQVHAALR